MSILRFLSGCSKWCLSCVRRWLSALRKASREHWMVAFPILSFIVILLPYMGMVPIWDAREYWNCLLSATETSFHPSNFRCFGHPTNLFMLFFGLSQYVSHGSIVLLNVLTIVLGSLSILSLYAILLFLFPRDRFLSMLLTLLYAWNPLMLANAVNFNPDTGIIFFFIIFVCALLYRMRFLALITGFFLCFTKEVGVPLLGLTVAAYLLFFVARSNQSLKTRLKKLCAHSYLFLPVIVFCIYAFVQKYVYQESPIWVGTNMSSDLLKNLTRINLSDHRFLITLADVYVMHFAWLSSLCILAAALVWVWRAVFALPSHPVFHFHTHREGALLVVAVAIAATYVVTSFPTYNNPRYYLPLYFLNILLFAVCLHYIFFKRSLKIMFTGLLAIMTLFSVFRSDDRVSQYVFGTVPFGDHQFYALLSAGGDGCCGLAGRDQLVYNLEYANMLRLQEYIYAQIIRPTNETIIVSNDQTGFGFSDPLDPTTFHRSFKADAIHPQYQTPAGILQMSSPPQEFYFILYPNFDDTQNIADLQAVYPVMHRWTVNQWGYSLDVLKMSK